MGGIFCDHCGSMYLGYHRVFDGGLNILTFRFDSNYSDIFELGLV